ncbi:hypothetical protein KM043_006958 [Ampulex compressa]|nr:hypothetical protein KM043_006958 [Ampulex compressa]
MATDTWKSTGSCVDKPILEGSRAAAVFLQVPAVFSSLNLDVHSGRIKLFEVIFSKALNADPRFPTLEDEEGDGKGVFNLR